MRAERFFVCFRERSACRRYSFVQDGEDIQGTFEPHPDNPRPAKAWETADSFRAEEQMPVPCKDLAQGVCQVRDDASRRSSQKAERQMKLLRFRPTDATTPQALAQFGLHGSQPFFKTLRCFQGHEQPDMGCILVEIRDIHGLMALVRHARQ